MRLEPRIIERVREVVLMGGAYLQGNVTPSAEFNIFADPEAAAAVFAASWTVTMVGLDLTHQALATPEVKERIRGIGSHVSQVVFEWPEFSALRTRRSGRCPTRRSMTHVPSLV
jgi:purine nucleosidase